MTLQQQTARNTASAQQSPRGRRMARVSPQELADAVGSVREVVARVLRDFRLEPAGGYLAGIHILIRGSLGSAPANQSSAAVHDDLG
jgi:hypothetical protein